MRFLLLLLLAVAGYSATIGPVPAPTTAPTDSVVTASIANLAVTDAKVATANKDGTAATPSMRTLGTSAVQAAPGNQHYVVASSTTANSVTGTVAATVLTTLTIPAGAIKPNGLLTVYTHFTTNATANLKIVNTKIGSTIVAITGFTNGSSVNVDQLARIGNRSNTTAIMTDPYTGGHDNGTQTTVFALDWTSAQSITVNATLSNTGDTITCESVYAIADNP